MPPIPEHWVTQRLKTVVAEKNVKGFPDEPLLAATQSRGVILKVDYETRTVEAQKSLETLKLVDIDDFVISLRSFQGGIERAHARGIISPAYTILQARHLGDLNYLTLLFKTLELIEALKLTVTGIREGQNIEYSRLSRDFMVLPPPAEQAAIVKYLGHAHARIDRAITAKRKLITLLEEQNQAIIHQAVTRGLGASSQLYDTGDEWFCDLPIGWTVTTLGRVIDSAIDGPHFSPDYEDSGVPFLSARNIRKDRWELSTQKYISQADFEVFSRRVRPEVGDLLYTKGGTTGVAKVVDLPYPFQVWVHVAVLKIRAHLVDADYLALALNSPLCYEQSQLATRGATNKDLGLSRMKRIFLPLPGTLGEQRAIVKKVREDTQRLHRTTVSALREIELLREFRARLTSDVVTGQVDVREIATTLPELTGEVTAEAMDESGDDDESIGLESEFHGADE